MFKVLHSTYKVLAMVFVVVQASSLPAQTLDSIVMRVVLNDDGGADITERRHMYVTEDITEGFIVMENLVKRDISQFSVSEDSDNYAESKPWNIHATREAKARHYGIVDTDDRHELCWGLGTPGRHTYNISYHLSGLVRSYPDADGFNFLFVTPDIKPVPGKVTITFCLASSPNGVSRGKASPLPLGEGLGERSLDSTNCKIWSFGYHGSIVFTDSGTVVAETNGALVGGAKMIVMMAFKKGLLNPQVEGDGTFEDVKDMAFEGSDYGVSGNERRQSLWKQFWSMDIFSILEMLFTILVILLCVFVAVWKIGRAVFKPLRHYLLRHRLTGGKNLGWYRKTPYKGCLLLSAQALNALAARYSPDFKSIIGAYILRLIYNGSLVIDPQTQKLRVGEYHRDGSPKTDADIEAALHAMLKEAAGDNSLIDKGELKRWAKKHKKDFKPLMEQLRQEMPKEQLKAKDAQQLYGLRKFLKEFTLVGERGAVEVRLWNEYLVFATLFGIAGQVARDFRKVCPEYFELSKVGKDVAESVGIISGLNSLVSDYLWDLYRADIVIDAVATTWRWTGGLLSRSSGGGGSSSYGGGGGHGGGGSGGGAR